MPTENTINAPCNDCGRATNHRVVAKIRPSKDETFDFGATFTIWRKSYFLSCAGCDSVTLRIVDSTSDDFDEVVDDTDCEYYPPRIFRPKPNWLTVKDNIYACPVEVLELLVETYVCLQNNCPRAAAMTVRAMLETIFVETNGGDRGSFKANVRAFQEGGHISAKQVDLLNAVLEVGHAAIHRSFKPSAEDLTLLVDYAENLIHSRYVQPGKAEQLKRRVPPRSKNENSN